MNRLRSREEIIDRIRMISRDRVRAASGYEVETLLPYLEYEDAKEFTEDENLANDDDPACPCTRERVLDELKGYLPTAWAKVRGHRGLSANRSVDRMRSWCWLLGVDERIDWDNYAQYGAPILYEVSRVLGVSSPDDEEITRMVEGLPCREGCTSGCGI